MLNSIEIEGILSIDDKNQAFSEWDSIFCDNMMTVAAIERLVHHADIYQ